LDNSKVGGALSFDGVDDYVRVKSTPIITSGDSTWIVWVKVVNPSQTSANIFLSQERSYLTFDYSFPGKASFNVPGSDICSNTSVSSNTWYFLAGVYRGNQQEVWINGILDKVRSGSASYMSYPVDFGRYSGGYYANGLIDEVRIYNRALSDAEIQALYNAKK
jgi:hypothetical protein